MISQILYIYGFSLLLLSKVYAVYWNETDFFNVDRRESRRIRNKFVTFETTDTDIELAFQFNIPFIAVPTDTSNIQTSVASYVNVNLASVTLAGVMIMFGSVASYLLGAILPKKNPNFNNNGNTNPTPTDDGTTPDIDDITNTINKTTNANEVDADGENAANESDTYGSERANDDGQFLDYWNLVQAIAHPSVCVQHYLCSVSKSSAKNVADGCGTSSDKIIDGIFGTRWILDLISGSAVHDAVRFGESFGDCNKKYSKCGVSSADFKELLKMFKKGKRT